MFRTVSLSIIRSFSLYTQQWYMSQRFADSLRAGSGRSLLILLGKYSVLPPVDTETRSFFEFDVHMTVHRDKFL